MSTELEAIIKSAITQEETVPWFLPAPGRPGEPSGNQRYPGIPGQGRAGAQGLSPELLHAPRMHAGGGSPERPPGGNAGSPGHERRHLPQGGPGHRRQAGGGGLPLLSGPGRTPAPGGGPGFPE